MTLSQRFRRGIRRYELPLGLLILSVLGAAAGTVLASSVVFGAAMFLAFMMMFGLIYGLPALGRWLIEHSGVLERSKQVDVLYQWVLSNHDFVGVVLICFGFTVAGVGLAVVETGADRLFGIATVLFFGPGCVFILGSSHLGHRMSNDSVESVQRDNQVANRTVHYHDQPHQALVFESPAIGSEVWLATLSLASWTASVVLLSLIMRGLIVWVLFICGILVGLLTLAGVLKLLRGRSTIALLEIGLVVRGGYSSVFVPWDAIEDIGLVGFGSVARMQPSFGLTVTDRSMIEGSWLFRLLSRANRLLTGYDIVHGMTAGPLTNQIEMAVSYFLDHPDERSELVRFTDTEELLARVDPS